MQGEAHNLHSDGAVGQQARALTDTNGGIQVGFRLGLPEVRVMINNIFLIRQATRSVKELILCLPLARSRMQNKADALGPMRHWHALIWAVRHNTSLPNHQTLRQVFGVG
jgi:hypothetical protein